MTALQFCRFFFYQLEALCDEVGEWLRALIAFTACAHADSVSFGFLVAHHQDVGNFLQREVADLGVHLFVAAIELDAESGIL